MIPFKYPELTTFILQYLPTKQIVNLYCNSNTIATSILLSSYIMNSNIKYNKRADYSNFPTHQFTGLTDLYLNEIEFNELKNMFNSIMFIYDYHKYNEEFYMSDSFKEYLIKFDSINPRYNINHNMISSINYMQFNKLNIMYNTTPTNNTIGTNNDKIEKIHNILLSKQTDSLSTDINANNCSLYLSKQSDQIISNTTINHLILENCNNITIESQIKGNVVIINCEKVFIKQHYVDKVTIKYGVYYCMLNNVGTLDASKCIIKSQDITKYDTGDGYSHSKMYGIAFRSVDKLYIREHDSEFNAFGHINTLCYKTPLTAEFHEQEQCYIKMLKNNDIKNLELYIYDDFVIEEDNGLETLTVSYGDCDVEDDIISEIKDNMYSIYDPYENEVDYYSNYNSCDCINIKSSGKCNNIKLTVSNCPILKKIIIKCDVKYIKYKVSNCENLENINYIFDITSENTASGCPKLKEVGAKFI